MLVLSDHGKPSPHHKLLYCCMFILLKQAIFFHFMSTFILTTFWRSINLHNYLCSLTHHPVLPQELIYLQIEMIHYFSSRFLTNKLCSKFSYTPQLKNLIQEFFTLNFPWELSLIKIYYFFLFQLFVDVNEKKKRWIQKLCAFRKKKLTGVVLTWLILQ